jgi:hypothetical protein
MAIIAMAKLRRLDDRPSVYDAAAPVAIRVKARLRPYSSRAGIGAETCRSHIRAVCPATQRNNGAAKYQS